MIVLVLVIVWVAALSPFVYRKLSEHQLTGSVAHFRYVTGMFIRARVMAPGEEFVAAQMPEFDPEAKRRLLRARARVRRQRRRRALTGLLGFGAFSLVFGAIPRLHMLWYLAIVDVLLTALYLGSLAYLTRLESFERERRAMRNVYPIGEPRTLVTEASSYYAAAGARSAVMPTPIPVRPAFRIVEAPN